MSEGGVRAGVGKTALGAAMVRAAESRRRDRLFDDPYAAAFVDAAPGVFSAEQRAAAAGESGMASLGAAFSSYAVIRTRFFDDYLLGAAQQGIRQVVLLAAGLDTRAHRLAWPGGLRLFELDFPELLSFKERVLAEQEAVARCERTVVGADLRGDWPTPLAGAGFRVTEPAAWLPEGLLTYLSATEAADLLTSVGDLSAAGSRLALEFGNENLTTMRAQVRETPAMAEYAAMWKGGLPDAPGWLAGHGWLTRLHDRHAVATGYRRELQSASAGGFVTAVRA